MAPTSESDRHGQAGRRNRLGGTSSGAEAAQRQDGEKLPKPDLVLTSNQELPPISTPFLGLKKRAQAERRGESAPPGGEEVQK